MDIIQQLNNAIRNEQYSTEFWMSLANSAILKGFYKQQALYYANEEQKHKKKLIALRNIMLKYEIGTESWVEQIQRLGVLDEV